MIAADPMPGEVLWVAQHMRAQSREDIGCMWGGTDEELTASLLSPQGFRWVAYHNRYPCAIIGANLQRDNVWSLFGFGTEDWIKVWRLVTLVARRDMMRAVRDAGAVRAHCLSPAWHHDTHRWLRALGASHEAEMPAYGRNGEDMILFSWLRG